MTAVALLLLVPATLAAGYYLVLTIAGLGRRPEPVGELPRLAVVVPAHDEEFTLPATLTGLRRCDYPADKLRVLVVADNCSDATAAVARRHGVEVLERHDPERRGKGYALAVGLPAAIQRGAEAVLVLDADCVPAADTFRRLVLANGEAVQAAVRPAAAGAGPGGLAAAVGWAVDDGVDAGRSALGLGVCLRGTGMLFRRDLLERVPWQSFGLAEDAEQTAVLRRAGVRVRFEPGAVVRGEVPPSADALATQRGRWRAALLSGGCGPVERLLASKPLVLAQLLLACGVGAVAGFGSWAAGLLLATAAVYLRAGWVAGVRPTAGELLRTGGVAGRLVWLTLAGRAGGWVRTARARAV